MKRDIEAGEIFSARVRGLQAIYPEAHQALVNWGSWSRDRAGIFPPGIIPPGLWNEAVPSKFGDFADASDLERVEVVEQTEAKAEAAEKEPYDEKQGALLDERIHGLGGLAVYQREALRVAYVTREVPEDQFARLSGCTEDAFCERLEACLMFVRRFIG